MLAIWAASAGLVWPLIEYGVVWSMEYSTVCMGCSVLQFGLPRTISWHLLGSIPPCLARSKQPTFQMKNDDFAQII